MIIQKEPTINSLSFGQLSAFVLTLPPIKKGMAA